MIRHWSYRNACWDTPSRNPMPWWLPWLLSFTFVGVALGYVAGLAK